MPVDWWFGSFAYHRYMLLLPMPVVVRERFQATYRKESEVVHCTIICGHRTVHIILPSPLAL